MANAFSGLVESSSGWGRHSVNKATPIAIVPTTAAGHNINIVHQSKGNLSRKLVLPRIISSVGSNLTGVKLINAAQIRGMTISAAWAPRFTQG